MSKIETIIDKLERGRAEFAYRCVQEAIEFKIKNSYKEPKKIQETFYSFVEQFLERIEKDKKISDEEKTKKKNRIKEIFANPDRFLNKNEYEKLSPEEKKYIEAYKNFIKNYRAYTRKIPQMILSNGLGQTLSFVIAKSDGQNAYDLIYKQLTEYMKSDSVARIKLPDNKDLTEWVISCNSSEYRYITQEILAFLNWAKRLAEGLIETEDEGE